jgi:anaerobic magnesium-protoporphyrin IX monomethyl ester cyclase
MTTQQNTTLHSEKLKVALIRSPIVFKDGGMNNEATPAIGFAYILGFLRKFGYEPVMVDAIGENLHQIWPTPDYPTFNCRGLKFEEIINRVPKGTQVIGFSGMFSGEWPILRDLILEVRKHFPEALLICGGEHATSLAEYSLRDCPSLDLIVLGEGEQTFLDVLETYSDTGSFNNINGTAYLDDEGNFCFNEGPPPRIRNIDEVPWPHWPKGYMEKFWNAGKSYGVGSERDMPFMVSRGCPYQCTFCSSPEMWTTRYLLRDVDDCISEVKHYIKHYQITALQFYDLTAIIKKDWIVQFCQKLIEENINLKWSLPSGTRSEALDAEVLALLKKTGCNYLAYAPESGSETTLKNIKKKIKLPNLTKSVLEAKRLGMVLRVNLIIGFPCETWKDVFRTLIYGLKMVFHGADEVAPNLYSPYPGTEIFNELVKKSEIKIDDDYFFSLTSLNSAYFSKATSFNPRLPANKLQSLRVLMVFINYSMSYLVYPKRIFRTLKNLFSKTEAATVFEHRLKDFLTRRIHAIKLSKG